MIELPLSPWTALLLGWLGAALVMAALWAVQLRTRDASAVDVAWAALLGVLALFYAAVGDGDPQRRLIVAVLTTLWSFRLAGYLLVNRVIGKPEDGRYQALRASWGKNAPRNFFLFYQAQAAFDAIFSVPFLLVAFHRAPGLAWTDWAGAAVIAIAIAGESVADRQLARFRADPANRGTTCRAGLWQYSRHPNYFFEWLHWWAYPLLAAGSPWWWVTLLGPAFMLYLLFKVTGIPATEAQALRTRRDYADYQRTTSAFVPWFPRRAARTP
jgi:steroid 5-alpha reductase family enzyme